MPRLADTALFLDVDGTLLEFAATPDQVVVSAALHTLLADLKHACHGAVALVSGRSIESLDALFGSLALPLAGTHGLELFIDGQLEQRAQPLAETLVAELHAVHDAHPGSLLEMKALSASLHYRRAPQHAASLTARMRDLASRERNRLRLLEGNHVLELVPRAGDKGTAIRALCEREPWAGRQPVFVGDDTTDEPGFDAVRERGGLAVRIGPRAGTRAQWQLDSVGAAQAWLQQALIQHRTEQESPK